VFDAVLVANRGEIARRVLLTLRRLGIRGVAVHSDADRDAPFVREADAALRIGPAAPAESYLSIERILDAARRAGADAIHPGYGFLSERPDFAAACADAGVVFVGPPPAAMALMADKVAAKAAAEAAGVPVVPGLTAEAAAVAPPEAYPLLVKAAAGGGGRGMRVVARPEDLEAALAAARREARAGFGDERVFVERFLPCARHLEVQVIADRHGAVLHLGERECSLQRRHQKVIEEAPSPVVGAALRERLGSEAVALARAAGYENAGTVEFIADFDRPEEHFFLEMNARLQVEHPVTELVTGLDLVELQLRVAAGEPLPLAQDAVRLDGHAIEARVTAEDAARGFLPAAGRIRAYRRPAGVRVDDGIEAGVAVGTDYDSLLAKVIAHGADRASALRRLDRALAGTAILGVTTTTAQLRRLLADDAVRAGRLDTGLVERLAADEPRPPTAIAPAEAAAAAALIRIAGRAEAAGDDPAARADGWRLGGERAWSHWRLEVDGAGPFELRTQGDGREGAADTGDGPVPASVRRTGDATWSIETAAGRREWTAAADGVALWLGAEGQAFRVSPPAAAADAGDAAHGLLRAPMPGQVLDVPARIGDAVRRGDAVVVIESMKMELTVAAPVDGVVTELAVRAGDAVGVDQVLAQVEAAA
jgi:3-methylcrotonyl-CoA carboxylase alpha subunit